MEVSSIKISTPPPNAHNYRAFFPYFRTFATETFIFQEKMGVLQIIFLAENQEYNFVWGVVESRIDIYKGWD